MKKLDLHLALFALAGAFLCLAFITSGGNTGYDSLTLWSKVNATASMVLFAAGFGVYLIKLFSEWLKKF